MSPDHVIGFRADTDKPPALSRWRIFPRRTEPTPLVEISSFQPTVRPGWEWRGTGPGLDEVAA